MQTPATRSQPQLSLCLHPSPPSHGQIDSHKFSFKSFLFWNGSVPRKIKQNSLPTLILARQTNIPVKHTVNYKPDHAWERMHAVFGIQRFATSREPQPRVLILMCACSNSPFSWQTIRQSYILAQAANTSGQMCKTEVYSPSPRKSIFPQLQILFLSCSCHQMT